MKEWKFTSDTIGSEPILIHLELNKNGSRISVKGDKAATALYLAIAAKLDPNIGQVLEMTKSILLDQEGDLAQILTYLQPGKPTIP